MTHHLKCWPEPYQAIRMGKKTFEFRKNDRDYNEKDRLVLQEWSPEEGYSGNSITVYVTYILREGFGIPDGYCIMSILVY